MIEIKPGQIWIHIDSTNSHMNLKILGSSENPVFGSRRWICEYIDDRTAESFYSNEILHSWRLATPIELELLDL